MKGKTFKCRMILFDEIMSLHRWITNLAVEGSFRRVEFQETVSQWELELEMDFTLEKKDLLKIVVGTRLYVRLLLFQKQVDAQW